MKFGIRFTSSLKKVEGVSIHAPFFRSLDIAFVHDPLGSLGAKKHGGRYNQKRLFEVLYLAPDPETALKEGRKSFSAYLPPTAVITAEVGLQQVLDLQDENVVKELGIRRENLFMNWVLADKETYTQKLGRLIHESKLFEAIRVPSARVAGKYNLAIFPDRLFKSSKVIVYDPDQKIKAELSG